VLAKFTSMAAVDPSPVVRLYLASAMQRIPIAQRAAILDALLAHAEDADDANLPQMYWYATEPLVATDRNWAVATLGKSKIAKVRELIARRLATR
jgi:phospholipase C